MSEIRLTELSISNYRSFGATQTFRFPDSEYLKPVSIIGYNNSGKTNLMNSILHGIGLKFIKENTFEIADLHNLTTENQITIKTSIESTPYGIDTRGNDKTIAGDYIISTEFVDGEIKSSISRSFYGSTKHYNIFYLNFHNIKDELSIKKSSWGSLTSFLAKHIKKLVDSDEGIAVRKGDYIAAIKDASDNVLANSTLSSFIARVKANYSTNLRNNNCEIEFGLPEYEDIFMKMAFKIGLNGDNENLIPIGHFGDGYISMFVMAVIQAIAETNVDDKCLFLFEEPESFLHENHQEYFYEMVLCALSEKGHQVIYTTHSDKMVDVFDTKSIIRLEFDEATKSTINKYNNIEEFEPDTRGIISFDNYNSYIKCVEPNLNRILFSRKVVLVEGPNDLMVYKYIVEDKINGIVRNMKYSKSHLNYKNIVFAVHHGKATAFIMAELCKHFGLDFFMINDLDFEDDLVDTIHGFLSEEDLKESDFYNTDGGISRTPNSKGMLTTNWKLLNHSQSNQIHFNIPKLENLIGYDSNNKDSIAIWKLIQAQSGNFGTSIFPDKLSDFLEINDLIQETLL